MSDYQPSVRSLCALSGRPAVPVVTNNRYDALQVGAEEEKIDVAPAEAAQQLSPEPEVDQSAAGGVRPSIGSKNQRRGRLGVTQALHITNRKIGQYLQCRGCGEIDHIQKDCPHIGGPPPPTLSGELILASIHVLGGKAKRGGTEG